MSIWKIGAAQERRWEIVIEAETEGRARALARQAIEEGTRPEGLVDFYDSEESLDLWSLEVRRERG